MSGNIGSKIAVLALSGIMVFGYGVNAHADKNAAPTLTEEQIAGCEVIGYDVYTSRPVFDILAIE